YDSNGNLIDDGSKQYYYDFQNHIVKVLGKSGGMAIYSYDALGRRVQRTVNELSGTSDYVRYVNSGSRVVEEESNSNTATAQYVDGVSSGEHLQMKRDLNNDGAFEANET